jgi:excisionase family DNA binding protein
VVYLGCKGGEVLKTYSVKEIADLLNTNPETVRRWIRDKKLEATIESKKGGHIVYESALHTFLKSSPKYASIASTALISTVMVGGLIAQKIIDVEQLKKARISDADIIKFLRSEIDSRMASIKNKEESISQLNMQIRSEQIQIDAFQQMIDTLCQGKGENK